jgi:DNA-binding SARP family transcriptional activator
LIELDPLAEVAHRELMLCYAALGERGRALQQYEVVRVTLQEQLGVGPDPQTTAVRDSLRGRIVAAR